MSEQKTQLTGFQFEQNFFLQNKPTLKGANYYVKTIKLAISPIFLHVAYWSSNCPTELDFFQNNLIDGNLFENMVGSRGWIFKPNLTLSRNLTISFK